VCGDALVCGAEQCESDGDCGGGQACEDCACVNAPLCSSGLSLERGRLKARATPFSLKLSAEVLIPKPWTGVSPATAGIRVRIDTVSGAGSIDALLPGGARWKANGSGTTWTYTDPAGTEAGLTKVVVKDRSNVEEGRLRVGVKGKSTASTPLPDPASLLRATLVLGDADECGALAWSAPGGPAPACSGSTASVNCR